MNFDLNIEYGDLTIYCSKELENFSNDFIDYYNKHINIIKTNLGIKKNIKLIVALTDDVSQAYFVYGVSDFSGFFNDDGVFAYINLNGKKNKDYMFKGLMHELTHHLYKYYVYGKEKERITWVDEGIAQFISGQRQELKDITLYNTFLQQNLINIEHLNLNELNHNDKSFRDYNGYNLSYIAIRYLYETKKLEEFINIINNQETLLKIGESILHDVCNYYNMNLKNHNKNFFS